MTQAVRPHEGAIFDLSARTKLRISGADGLRYLNGQISNDARKAKQDQAVHACVLNAKGKINADIFLVAAGDAFLIDTDAEMRETLPARLERYIIADDVQIEDVTDHYSLVHLLDAEAARVKRPGWAVVEVDRFGKAGTDIWLPAAERAKAWNELRELAPTCDEECAERFRIERGLPRWGRELTEEIIPTEANLEASVIDYSKGCYIGQEVISRIKMSGQTNKRLCGLVSLSGRPLDAGMRLTSDAEVGREVGWVTSATRSLVLEKEIALGFVKRGFNAVGAELNAVVEQGETAPLRVQIVPLPFV